MKYHLDDVLKLLSSDCDHRIIKLPKETKGAACTALMGIEHINNDTELLIANSDQILDRDALNAAIAHFRAEKADAGVICFNSVHPRWSYACTDHRGRVTELAEKHPISNHAIAGVYYFKEGRSFVKSAFDSILKDARVDGMFYVAPTMNELILNGENVLCYQIPNESYHSFYSPQRIRDFCTKGNSMMDVN